MESVFTPEVREYAALLLGAGFTVYQPAKPDRGPVAWFHYSREVEGQTCYGTFSDGSEGFEGAHHSMPITPSLLNGSSALIGAVWGDPVTLGLDVVDPMSVAYAEAVARPSNWCPFNAEPTREAVAWANRITGTPGRFYMGATLKNAQPWGIGTHYVEL